MNIPDWLKEVSIYLWLAVAGLVMFVFSLSSGKLYLDLWLITFLYGLWGFVADKIKNEKARITILFILLIIYTFVVSRFLTGVGPN